MGKKSSNFGLILIFSNVLFWVGSTTTGATDLESDLKQKITIFNDIRINSQNEFLIVKNKIKHYFSKKFIFKDHDHCVFSSKVMMEAGNRQAMFQEDSNKERVDMFIHCGEYEISNLKQKKRFGENKIYSEFDTVLKVSLRKGKRELYLDEPVELPYKINCVKIVDESRESLSIEEINELLIVEN
jgi:hypothetical protein